MGNATSKNEIIAKFATPGTPFAKLLEPRFVKIYMGLCVYYFYAQMRNFTLTGNYIGKDPSEKSAAYAVENGSQKIATYFREDRQNAWHQKYYHAFSDGSLFQYGHCAGGFLWWATMFLQLSGAIRDASVPVHVGVGVISFLSGQALAISGFYGLMGGGRLDLTEAAYKEDLKAFPPGVTKTLLKLWLRCYIITFWCHGAYLSFTGFMYLYYIANGQRLQHRKWILRHMMVGFATLMKRVTYAYWPAMVVNSPVDLTGIPASVVKATCANVWIYIAHALGHYLITMKTLTPAARAMVK